MKERDKSKGHKQMNRQTFLTALGLGATGAIPGQESGDLIGAINNLTKAVLVSVKFQAQMSHNDSETEKDPAPSREIDFFVDLAFRNQELP